MYHQLIICRLTVTVILLVCCSAFLWFGHYLEIAVKITCIQHIPVALSDGLPKQRNIQQFLNKNNTKTHPTQIKLYS